MNEEAKITKQETFAFNKKDTDCEDRLIVVKEKLIDPLINMHKETDIKVCIEGPSFASKGAYILQMGALNFFIRYWLRTEGVNYKVISPGELKKFVTGKGNCKKDLILLKVFKKWGIEFDSNDLADAYSLARFIFHEDRN